MRWLTILFSAQSHHSHVLCFLVGGSANGKREKRRRRRKRWRERREGEEGDKGGRGGKERRGERKGR